MKKSIKELNDEWLRDMGREMGKAWAVYIERRIKKLKDTWVIDYWIKK